MNKPLLACILHTPYTYWNNDERGERRWATGWLAGGLAGKKPGFAFQSQPQKQQRQGGTGPAGDRAKQRAKVVPSSRRRKKDGRDRRVYIPRHPASSFFFFEVLILIFSLFCCLFPPLLFGWSLVAERWRGGVGGGGPRLIGTRIP